MQLYWKLTKAGNNPLKDESLTNYRMSTQLNFTQQQKRTESTDTYNNLHILQGIVLNQKSHYEKIIHCNMIFLKELKHNDREQITGGVKVWLQR